MALSNISSKHVNELILSLSCLDLQESQIRQSIQRDSNNYAKLKTLMRQMAFIKQEVEEIIQDSMVNTELEKVSCKFKKIPGNYYYLYQKKESEELYFSMLEPEVWSFSKHSAFINKYFYDYDLNFQKLYPN